MKEFYQVCGALFGSSLSCLLLVGWIYDWKSSWLGSFAVLLLGLSFFMLIGGIYDLIGRLL